MCYYLKSIFEDKIRVLKICLFKILNNFVIVYFISVDFSLMNDYDDFIKGLDIVYKSYVILKKFLQYEGCNIIVRDIMFLIFVVNKSLDVIGVMYGDNFRKIELFEGMIENMDVLLEQDRNIFINYVMRDVLIVFFYVNKIVDFYFRMEEIGLLIIFLGLFRKYVELN